ncbi:hypothetical protein [Clostridium rectalis]|nr:hypothetical protein [Clostridium rectalis]
MENVLVIYSFLEPLVSIMAKMAFIFLAYKAMQVMNLYIHKNK